MAVESIPHVPRARRPWISWFLGAALLGAVITAALRVSEPRAFAGLLERADASWLALAFLLQAATYAAQGAIWRRVTAAAGYPLPRPSAIQLSFAKLFVDQALPSAGLSSSILVAKALENHGLPRSAISASVLVNIASYHLGYVIAVLPALAIVARDGNMNVFVVATAAAFIVFSLCLIAAVFALAGRSPASLAHRFRRLPAARTTFEFVAGADPQLVRGARVLLPTTALQLTIMVADAATMWVLIRALGTTASPAGVFASLMVASLFRTMGIVPGGLGTFEATSVLMLRMIGTDLAVAVAATMLFRGLTFWLPMVPGYWLSHRVIAPSTSAPG